MSKKIGVGVIGAGYMGKAHAVAFHAVGAACNTALRPQCVHIATSNDISAARAAKVLGFQRGSGDWRALIADENVDAVVVASPQHTHLEIVLAAFAAGKHVLCEKPLAMNLAEAEEMTAAANASDCVHMMGFNYVRTPATQYARKLVEEGAIGDLIYIRCEHAEDFLADATSPPGYNTRDISTGNLGDLAPHPINLMLALGGNVDMLVSDYQTVYAQRDGEDVGNDDQAHWMCRFANGAMGYVLSTRVAHGRKMGYTYEIHGTTGTIRFDQEDQNTIWLYEHGSSAAQSGFKKILTNPEHPDYVHFNLGPGHGTGYQDQLIIEARDFLHAIESNQNHYPNFNDGLAVHRVVDAIYRSKTSGKWENV